MVLIPIYRTESGRFTTAVESAGDSPYVAGYIETNARTAKEAIALLRVQVEKDKAEFEELQKFLEETSAFI